MGSSQLCRVFGSAGQWREDCSKWLEVHVYVLPTVVSSAYTSLHGYVTYRTTACDLTDNLWMNLTDGTILCGRKNYDGWMLLHQC